jgi:glutamyl-tRNA reductase
VVSVSSNGVSCRRTRLIKESLSRHLVAVDGADFLIIGTDHNYLGIDEREKYHLVGERYAKVAGMLSKVWGVHEFTLLNTCNRIELAAVVSPSDGLLQMLEHVIGFSTLPEDAYYVKTGHEAFAHLAFVSSGLMSQMPGEKHITAQVKDALRIAKSNGWADAMLQSLFDGVLHVSKHIRQELEPQLRNLEIEDLTFSYLDSKIPDMANSKIVVIGTGVIGRNLVDGIALSCAEVAWIFHRNEPDEHCRGNVSIYGLNQLKDQLPGADAVVCATSAEHPLLHQGHAPFMEQSKQVTIIDLAIPRNASPELENIMANLKIADLDDLKRWRRREALDMAGIFEKSSEIIREHRDVYDRFIHDIQGGNESQRTRSHSDEKRS